jgi:hypothetical protein
MMGLKNVPCATLLPVRPTDRWHGDLGAIGWDAETNTVVAAIEWIPGMQQRCDNVLPVNSWGPAWKTPPRQPGPKPQLAVLPPYHPPFGRRRWPKKGGPPLSFEPKTEKNLNCGISRAKSRHENRPGSLQYGQHACHTERQSGLLQQVAAADTVAFLAQFARQQSIEHEAPVESDCQ